MPPRKRRSVDYPACILQQKPDLGTQRAAQLHVVVETATWLVNHSGGYIRKRHRSTEHRLAGREQADVPFQSQGAAARGQHAAGRSSGAPADATTCRCAARSHRPPLRRADRRSPRAGPGRWRPRSTPGWRAARASPRARAAGSCSGSRRRARRDAGYSTRGWSGAAGAAPRGFDARCVRCTLRRERNARAREATGQARAAAASCCFGLPRHKALKVTHLRRPRSRCSSCGVAHPGRGC